MKKKLIIGLLCLLIIIGVLCFIFLKKDNKEVSLNIDCDGIDLSKTYKEGDTFECTLISEKFTLEIKTINKNEIKLHSNRTGLFPRREDNSISLIDKVEDFTLEKGEELDLALQATDVTADLKISYK